MGAANPTRADAAPRFVRERRFRRLAAVLGSLFVVDVVATVLATPSPVLSVGRNLFLLPIPFAVWWAFRRAPSSLRLPLLLFALAAIVWLLGSAVWYAYFFAAGATVPKPPTSADGFFLTGRLLIISGIVVALHSAIPFRIAALDAVVIVSATLA
ncbi:MAG: hypothetical protein M3295_09260, partial [Chloroflexota bacterium]|nr:hypothetical protein [Chloroflexota bacterium]